MNTNSRIGGFVKNHGISLVIGAATAGFAAHINSSVIHINNNVSNIHQKVSTIDQKVLNIDQKVLNIETTIIAQDTSVARSIATVQDTLNAITQKIGKFKSLHGTLGTRIDTLQDTLNEMSGRVAVIDDSLTSKAAKLKESVASFDSTIEAQSTRFAQEADSLKHAVQKIREQNEGFHSVRIFVGKEKALRDCGYLRTSGFLCCKKYRINQFPATNDSVTVNDIDLVEEGKVVAVHIGKPFCVEGKLVALCGYHGKLRKGKDYAVSKPPCGHTRVTFTRSIVAGQPILVVLK